MHLVPFGKRTLRPKLKNISLHGSNSCDFNRVAAAGNNARIRRAFYDAIRPSTPDFQTVRNFYISRARQLSLPRRYLI
jgi:hypothetical protein